MPRMFLRHPRGRGGPEVPELLDSRARGNDGRGAHQRFLSAGFTLLEILVVIVIIGVMVAATTLSIGVLGADREVEDETRRFWAVLQQAREEAELQGQEIGVFISAHAYEFLRYEPRRDRWAPIVYDEFYRSRELPEGLRYRLWIDGREVVLKLQPPERGDEDEDEDKELNKRAPPPQIFVLSSGDIVPFELRIERDALEALWRVVAEENGNLRLDRRSGDRDWVLVAQTNEPEEEDERRVAAR